VIGQFLTLTASSILLTSNVDDLLVTSRHKHFYLRFILFGILALSNKDRTILVSGGARLDTVQLDTTNHSARCLEAFHCSSAVSGSCSIDSCPNGGHPKKKHYSITFMCRSMTNSNNSFLVSKRD